MDAASFTDPPFVAPPLDRVDHVSIDLLGEPKGKGRPRFVRKTGVAYTPAATRSYEGCLKHEAAMVMGGAPPIDGPIVVSVTAFFSVPQSWSAKKKEAALAGKLSHTTRPDVDNIVKMLDALNGIVWLDDKQIASSFIFKKYAERPRLNIIVARLP